MSWAYSRFLQKRGSELDFGKITFDDKVEAVEQYQKEKAVILAES
jgi:hypothetical protein